MLLSRLVAPSRRDGAPATRVFRDHEAVGLARPQNDVLLALTARHTGALLLTADRHFEALRNHLDFRMKVLQAGVP